MRDFDDYDKAAMAEVDQAITYLDFEILTIAELLILAVSCPAFQTDPEN